MTMMPRPEIRFHPEEVWLPFSESIFEWDDRFHELLLNDRIRVSAYRAAIQRTVNPGSTVLDLGTGTGVLALWALEAGAKRVYGLEMNRDILNVAIQRISAAGHTKGFIPICDLSFNVSLPERVDVLISEIVGNLADNENFVPILSDAVQRFLIPNGTQIPAQVVSYLVPVEANAAHEQVRSGRWRALGRAERGQGQTAETSTVNRFNLYYDAILPLSGYLAEPKVLRRFNGAWKDSPTYTVERIWRISRSGRLTGLKGFFVAELAEGVVLDISGDDVNGRMSSDSWKHAYLPVEVPIFVECGDVLHLEFSRSVAKTTGTWGKQTYRWTGKVKRNGVTMGEFDQSTGRNR